MLSVREVNETELAARGYQSDPAQLRAVQALDRCAREWAQFKEQRSNVFKKLLNRPAIPRGVRVTEAQGEFCAGGAVWLRGGPLTQTALLPAKLPSLKPNVPRQPGVKGPRPLPPEALP